MYGVCRVLRGMSEGVRRGGMYGVCRFLMLTDEERVKSKYLVSIIANYDKCKMGIHKEQKKL
jgi:hypothetical protein